MYVLVIARGYPSKKYKMNGIFEFDQAKSLIDSGCKVVYAAIDIRSLRRRRKWGIENIIVNGINIYTINIPCGKIPKFILNKIMTLGLFYLYKLILKKEGKPDVIHAHFTRIGFIASKLKEKYNIPLIITEHSSLLMKDKIDKNIFKLASKTYKQADALISVSPALSNIIEKNFKIETFYIPNIVNTDIFYFKKIKTHNSFNFVSVGGLVYIKGMDLTIKAFYKTFWDKPDVSLTIFGDGIERSRLEKLIKEYNLEKKIILMGMCDRKIIAKKLMDSDCFILASRSETFGVAYIEALAAGVPVIATQCGGPEAFVNETNGMLVPRENVDLLSTAMEYMYINIKQFDKERISNNIKLQFSPEIVSKNLIKIYNNLI